MSSGNTHTPGVKVSGSVGVVGQREDPFQTLIHFPKASNVHSSSLNSNSASGLTLGQNTTITSSSQIKVPGQGVNLNGITLNGMNPMNGINMNGINLTNGSSSNRVYSMGINSTNGIISNGVPSSQGIFGSSFNAKQSTNPSIPSMTAGIHFGDVNSTNPTNNFMTRVKSPSTSPQTSAPPPSIPSRQSTTKQDAFSDLLGSTPIRSITPTKAESLASLSQFVNPLGQGQSLGQGLGQGLSQGPSFLGTQIKSQGTLTPNLPLENSKLSSNSTISMGMGLAAQQKAHEAAWNFDALIERSKSPTIESGINLSSNSSTMKDSISFPLPMSSPILTPLNSSNSTATATILSTQVPPLNHSNPTTSLDPSSSDPFDISFLTSATSTLRLPEYILPSTSLVLSSSDEDENPLGILGSSSSRRTEFSSHPNPISFSSNLPKSTSGSSPISPQSKALQASLSSPISSFSSPSDSYSTTTNSPASSLDFKKALIVEMGFNSSAAQSALEASNGNTSTAIEILMDQSKANMINQSSKSTHSSFPSQSQKGHRQNSSIKKVEEGERDDGEDGEETGLGYHDGSNYSSMDKKHQYDDEDLSNSNVSNSTPSDLTKQAYAKASSFLAFGKAKFKSALEKASQSEVLQNAKEVLRSVSAGDSSRIHDYRYDDGHGLDTGDPDDKESSQNHQEGWKENSGRKGEDGSSSQSGYRDDDDHEPKSYPLPRETLPSNVPYSFQDSVLAQKFTASTSNLNSSPSSGMISPSKVTSCSSTPMSESVTSLINSSFESRRPVVTASPFELATSLSHKEKGSSFFRGGQFGDAESCYSLAIQALPLGHLELLSLYNNRAAARLKTGDYRGVISDSTEARSLNSNDLKSLLRRATAWEQLEKWNEALIDYKTLMSKDTRVKGVSLGMARCQHALELELKGNQVLDEQGKSVDQSSSFLHDIIPSHSNVLPNTNPKDKPSSSFKVGESSRVEKLSGSALADMFGTPSLPTQSESSFTSQSNVDVNNSEAVQRLRTQDKKNEMEQAQGLAMKDQIDNKIIAWRAGKEDNLRALLASLNSVLWPEVGWINVGLGDLIEPSKVKIKYMKAIGKVHPDKLSNNVTIEQKLLANAIFSTLNKAWDSFKAK